MLTPTRLLIAFSFLAVSTQVNAACTTQSFDGTSMSRCNVWPAFPSQAISVKSTYLADSGGDDAGVFDLDLSIVNASNAKPIATYRKPGAFNSDAVRFDDLRIDTARYRLAPEVRAFGLRAKFVHSSHAIPYEKTDLALYVREGDELRPVLEGLVVYKNNGEFTNDCEGYTREIRRTLDIGPSSHHGFADLIVTTRGTKMKNTRSASQCVSKTTHLKSQQITLTYDGQQYIVPEDLRGY
ncbi:PA3715 family protein [Pseudomonas sp. GNP014]